MTTKESEIEFDPELVSVISSLPSNSLRTAMLLTTLVALSILSYTLLVTFPKSIQTSLTILKLDYKSSGTSDYRADGLIRLSQANFNEIKNIKPILLDLSIHGRSLGTYQGSIKRIYTAISRDGMRVVFVEIKPIKDRSDKNNLQIIVPKTYEATILVEKRKLSSFFFKKKHNN
ncbi:MULTISPECIES: hypothetical protein [unclassified Mucilaginibacter]|uniref:hypothetical protein n=1 Tax=unclassified Mucilaginibacter TaxID=2617802 RepID=UPI002AC9581F|nr:MULTISPECIES: hypothetical protein [unclassified Mucilaginibacter]MEB0280866.1 hypothetical protein [Mucilaginibacter sp. 10B2]MEB0302753.1 hypothetical protein [Mucilaginibacter sp. 5C4]WPX25651.1 hypothetical protein RHM67_10280 [Mucilaginibacter sp. 5C4]